MMVIPPIMGNLKVSIQWCTMKLGKIHSTSWMLSTNNHLGYNKKDPIQSNDYFAAFEEVPIQDTDEGFSDLASISTTCNEYLKLVNGSKIEGMQWIGCSCCHCEGWMRKGWLCNLFQISLVGNVSCWYLSAGGTFWMQKRWWYLRKFHLWVHVVWLEPILWFLKYHWGCRGGIHIVSTTGLWFNTSPFLLVRLLWFLWHNEVISVWDLFGRCFNVNHVLFIWWIIVITPHSVHIWIEYSSMIGYAKVKHSRSLGSSDLPEVR